MSGMYVFLFRTPEGQEFTAEVESFADGMDIKEVEKKIREDGEVLDTWVTVDAYEYKDDMAENMYDEAMYDKYEDRYTPSATYGDYSPSDPWNAPGMKVSDFISGVRW